MKKNGFTLIELLAVVVLIGLLTVLIVSKVNPAINDSKKYVGLASTNNLISSLEDYYVNVKFNGSFEGCSYDFDTNSNTCTGFSFKGDRPESGMIRLSANGVISGTVTYGKEDYQISNNKIVSDLVNDGLNNVEFASNNYYTFSFTGSEQVFVVPKTGEYTLEVWGAQGGSGYSMGGYGGYSRGNIRLESGQKLYINVGGISNGATGGYNGGGNGSIGSENKVAGGGGGATHIALSSGVLSSLQGNLSDIIIVAGGGGGAGQYGWSSSNTDGGGSGGGYLGLSGFMYSGNDGTIGVGGSQSSGGTGINAGVFGIGGSATSASSSSGGGGGGFYGGGGAYCAGGGGGSSYIGNASLANKIMYCYGCSESNDAATKTVSTTGSSDLKDTVNCPVGFNANAVSNCAKRGNGFAKIYLSGSSNTSESDVDVYYSYGNAYENLYTYNTYSGQDSEAQFYNNYIGLASSNYNIVYTDAIDLSKYNTIILKKENSYGERNAFIQYPEQTNNGGESYYPSWETLTTNTYVADISSMTRNDLHFNISSWSGENAGNVYYFAFSTKTISEVMNDYSFIP